MRPRPLWRCPSLFLAAHGPSSATGDTAPHSTKYADAKAKGATLLGEWKREGNLIHPLLLDHVNADMKLAWEEQFGPVLPIMRISDAQQAIEHCNASRFALQGCVFTRDIDAAVRISDAMKTGTVQVRQPLLACSVSVGDRDHTVWG